MANAKKQVKAVEAAITSMDKVDKDAAWDESTKKAKNSAFVTMKNTIDTDDARDLCQSFLLALGERAAEYGMKPESEKKDF